MSGKLPLSGVRVIDLATFIAGPFTAAILGEFGAEVIKVEQPGLGDPLRKFGSPSKRGDGYAWLSEQRNKKSVTLDLRQPEGAALFKRLIATADILCENFRPGTLEKWGLGPDALKAVNPALVLVRISGYGQTGPYRDRPGFARIAHAFGGLTHLTGDPGGPPLTPGSTSLADYISGLYGAVGALMALRSREQVGGQVIDIALYESIFRVLDEMAPLFAATGFVRPRLGLMTSNVCPHGHFECGDGGWVAIACTSDKMWRRMAAVLGRDALGEDARFATSAGGWRTATRSRPWSPRSRSRSRAMRWWRPATPAACRPRRSIPSPISSRTRTTGRAGPSPRWSSPRAAKLSMCRTCSPPSPRRRGGSRASAPASAPTTTRSMATSSASPPPSATTCARRA